MGFMMASKSPELIVLEKTVTKTEELATAFNDLKTETATKSIQQAEKIAQMEKKVEQLFVFHNGNGHEFTELRENITKNTHDIITLKEATTGMETTIEVIKRDISNGLAQVNRTLDQRIAKDAGKGEAIGSFHKWMLFLISFMGLISTLGMLYLAFIKK